MKFQDFLQKILFMHRLWKMFLHLPELSNAFVKGDKIRPQKLCILLVFNPLLLAMKNDII